MDKTVYIKFRSRLHRNFPSSLTVLNSVVEFSERVGFLGTVLDRDLTWQSQVDKIAGRLNSACFALNSLRSSLDCETLLSIYYGIFYPHINYCNMVWGLSVHVRRLFILQKRAIRIIFNLKYRRSCSETFKNNRILTVPCIYIYKTIVFIHSNKSKFMIRSQIHNYNTRHSHQICTRSHDHAYYERSPIYAGISIYNRLPLEFRNIVSVRVFKNRLKKFLYTHAFYSVAEFIGGLSGGDVDGLI